jgi:hypothetical protein
MTTPILRYILAAALALGFVAAAPAQEPMVPPAYDEPPRFSQAELDSMLAPIALYPDQMLSQLLMAATFPRDVSEAAAWSRANRQAAGEAAVRAVANMPWDPSVKSLVAFPQVLAMMDEHMEWTERLGDAFMANPTQVSETIQVLRGRADQAGNLRPSEEMNVQRDYGNYVIEPARPDVVYVPYYDPRVVYGPWWWPDYAPVWWSPWAGYSWTPGYAFAWGYGVSIGGGFWYSSFDWPRRYVRFYSSRPYYYRGHSRYYGHRWYSDHDHHRNARGYQWSGNRGGDYGRDWQRGDGQRGDGRNYPRDGRDGRDSRGINRAPTEQRYTVPPAGRPERSIERQPLPSAVPSSSQPLSRGSVAPREVTAPAPTAQPAPYQPLQRVPVQQPMPQSAPAPQGAPSAPSATHERRPPAPAPADTRPEPGDRSESRPQRESSEPRQDRSGGNNPLGRGGGRSDRQ